LEDITLRAIRILREVDLVAAEDTRHTRKLLTHLGISKPLTSYYDHNQAFKGEAILARLRDGASVALVSDAGTPCIADPGYLLVRDAAAAGIKVLPIPGPAALLAALAAAGLPTDAFTFLGFLPSRPGKRRERLRELQQETRTLVFYEAPHRLAACLQDLAEILGDRPAAVARELTKLHEEFARGGLVDLAATFAQRTVKGEVVILVAPALRTTGTTDQAAESLEELLRSFLDAGLSVKDAARRIAVDRGRPRGEVYAEALRIKEEKAEH
jgi:16S rRNA (cytidine1402-2'-O)-methyltransferase